MGMLVYIINILVMITKYKNSKMFFFPASKCFQILTFFFKKKNKSSILLKLLNTVLKLICAVTYSVEQSVIESASLWKAITVNVCSFTNISKIYIVTFMICDGRIFIQQVNCVFSIPKPRQTTLIFLGSSVSNRKPSCYSSGSLYY